MGSTQTPQALSYSECRNEAEERLQCVSGCHMRNRLEQGISKLWPGPPTS